VKLLGDAAFTATARVLMLSLAAAINILVARGLGPAGRGLYALPSIDASLAITFALGLSSAVSYYMLKGRSGARVLGAALAAAGVFVVAGSLLTVAIAWWNHNLWAAWPALAYLPSYAVVTLVSGYCIGTRRVRTWSTINVATMLATLVLIGAGFLAFGRTPTVAIGGWVCGMLVVALAGAVAVARDARSRGGDDDEAPTGFMQYGGRSGLVNVMTLLNYRVDVYIVAALAPLSVLGMYAIAVAGAESALALTHTASMVTAPRIGSLDREEAGAFTARCTRSSLVVALFTCACIALFAPPIVHLLFGSAFLPLVPALRVLLIGVVALSIGGVISNYFMLNLGTMRVPFTTAAIAAGLCAVLSFVLIPRYGMLGAAISTTLAYVVQQALAVTLFCRHTRLSPWRVLVIGREDVRAYRTLALRLRPRRAS
jgi:stage V sporulation protein B